MQVSYRPLWKLLIDRDIKKKDLAIKAGISTSSITKLTNNANITTDVLLKICCALDCEFSDILEIIK